MQIVDTLKNLVSGLGTSKDKNVHTEYVQPIITEAQLNAMHRGDWLARKIIDIIPNDMTREWRDWKANDDQIELIEKLEKDPLISLQGKVAMALQKARLFGGCAIYMGLNPRLGLPEEPLDIEAVKQGDLQYLHLLDKYDLTVGEIIRDVTSPYYGQPSYYEVNGATGTRLRVHPSRMVRFIGAPILDRRYALENEAWGDSILQVVHDAVMNSSSIQEHIAALVPEAKQDVIYVPNLSEFLKNKATTDKLTDRFTYANTLKSMFNMILLEGDGQKAGEKWEQKHITFDNMPELLHSFLQIAAGAADIPVTRLLGQSPSGLNSTGDGDIRNYYDNIMARQRTELSPTIQHLDEVIIRSALGNRDEDVHYEWAPLYTLSEKEKADVFKTTADAVRAIAGSAAGELIPVDALSDALVNQLVEDGTLAGLEAAIEEYGRLSEQEEEEVDLTAALTPANANQLRQQTGQQNLRRAAANDKRFADATPKTLYVKRRVLNADEIISWAKGQGFTTTLEPDDLHVTIAFSRTPVDWMKVGENWSGDKDGRVTIKPGGPRLVERFDGGATVVLFASSELSWRHEDIKRAGGSWDYPEYQPHITISYDGPADLSAIEPYKGEIVLGPEEFAEIDEDWKAKVTEQ